MGFFYSLVRFHHIQPCGVNWVTFPFLGMAIACHSGVYTTKAIADYFGVNYTTVSRHVKEHEEKLERDVIVLDMSP